MGQVAQPHHERGHLREPLGVRRAIGRRQVRGLIAHFLPKARDGEALDAVDDNLGVAHLHEPLLPRGEREAERLVVKVGNQLVELAGLGLDEELRALRVGRTRGVLAAGEVPHRGGAHDLRRARQEPHEGRLEHGVVGALGGGEVGGEVALLGPEARGVAVQVDPFESKGLKPGFSLHRLN
jgi:hypothetical protein